MTIHTYNEGIPDVIQFLKQIVRESLPNYEPTKDYNQTQQTNGWNGTTTREN